MMRMNTQVTPVLAYLLEELVTGRLLVSIESFTSIVGVISLEMHCAQPSDTETLQRYLG